MQFSSFFRRASAWSFLLRIATTTAVCCGLLSCASERAPVSALASTPLQLQGGQVKVAIRRTALGVPHIKADDWQSLGYGYGYVQAQDNLCTLADSFLTYRGERSRYFGADAVAVARSSIGAPKNSDADFFNRHVITRARTEALRAAQPPELAAIVRGFAAGYNRYLDERRKQPQAQAGNAACITQAWVAHISSDDIYRRMFALNLAGGYDNFLESIANAAPPNTSNSAQAATNPVWIGQIGGGEGLGSNAIGFGSAATAGGGSLLFGNPHWFWRGADRFYQAQLTIPGVLDVAGVSILGTPTIMIGYNNNVAWSHTVSSARRFGIYQLTLAPDDPLTYLRDGQRVKMTAQQITIAARQPDGSIGHITRTLYDSQYGPLLDLGALNPALGWSSHTAFAIRDINSANGRDYRTWLRWARAGSLDEFIRIAGEEVAMPWVNTIAVGRGAPQAWYGDLGPVPNVDAGQSARCTTTIGKLVAQRLPGVPFFDGADSACDWHADTDAVQDGAMSGKRMPSLLRSDYVANMNDSYWSSNPHALLSGFPRVLGSEGEQALDWRTQLGHLMVQSRLNGSDGYAGRLADADSVGQMVLNSRVLTAELFKQQVLPAICAIPTIALGADPYVDGSARYVPPRQIDVSRACEVLRAWDNSGRSQARGAHIWDEFWLRLEKTPGALSYATPFDPSDPLHTPRDLKIDHPELLQQAFAAAVMRIQHSAYALDAVRSDYLFVSHGGQKTGLFGGCGGVGYFTIACSDQSIEKQGYSMDADPHGNTYLQIVSFPPGPGPVAVKTMLASSLSGDPASPHAADGAQAYATQSWSQTPFTEQQIASDPAYTITVIEGVVEAQ
jgi:acyl-homoserine-lactone acylase